MNRGDTRRKTRMLIRFLDRVDGAAGWGSSGFGGRAKRRDVLQDASLQVPRANCSIGAPRTQFGAVGKRGSVNHALVAAQLAQPPSSGNVPNCERGAAVLAGGDEQLAAGRKHGEAS